MSKGQVVSLRRYSDKCLELYLRANKPTKFAPVAEERGNNQQVQVVIYTNPRGSQPDTKPIPSEAASVDSPAKT